MLPLTLSQQSGQSPAFWPVLGLFSRAYADGCQVGTECGPLSGPYEENFEEGQESVFDQNTVILINLPLNSYSASRYGLFST